MATCYIPVVPIVSAKNDYGLLKLEIKSDLKGKAAKSDRNQKSFTAVLNHQHFITLPSETIMSLYLSGYLSDKPSPPSYPPSPRLVPVPALKFSHIDEDEGE